MQNRRNHNSSWSDSKVEHRKIKKDCRTPEFKIKLVRPRLHICRLQAQYVEQVDKINRPIFSPKNGNCFEKQAYLSQCHFGHTTHPWHPFFHNSIFIMPLSAVPVIRFEVIYSFKQILIERDNDQRCCCPIHYAMANNQFIFNEYKNWISRGESEHCLSLVEV